MATAISCKQLGVTFRGRGRNKPVLALQALDLEVASGRIVGVLGPNGSGKTTLLRVLAGLEQPTTGTVIILGERPTARYLRRRVALQPGRALPLGVLSRQSSRLRRCRARSVQRRVGCEGASPARTARPVGPGKRWIRTFSTGMQKLRAGWRCSGIRGPVARRTDCWSGSVRQRS